MNPIRNFDELMLRFRQLGGNIKVALVCPDDEASIYVVQRCLHDNLADFILIDTAQCSGRLQEICQSYPQRTEHIVAASADEAARCGVRLVKEGRADILMKGILNTDNLMRAVLDKSCGLLPAGHVLSHITLAQMPTYHKLLMFSDATVIPTPTLEQFDAMIRYDVDMCRALGIDQPKVALIHFTEKTSPKFQNTLDYVELRQRCANGRYGQAAVDGPMDVKTAADLHSSQVKGIDSPVAGDADVLIFPDLEAGNTFYKTISFFAQATMAGIISGAAAPIVLPSRADSGPSKLYSLALASMALRQDITA